VGLVTYGTMKQEKTTFHLTVHWLLLQVRHVCLSSVSLILHLPLVELVTHAYLATRSLQHLSSPTGQHWQCCERTRRVLLGARTTSLVLKQFPGKPAAAFLTGQNQQVSALHALRGNVQYVHC